MPKWSEDFILVVLNYSPGEKENPTLDSELLVIETFRTEQEARHIYDKFLDKGRLFILKNITRKEEKT